MTVFIVQTYVARPDKGEELSVALDEIRNYKEARPKLFSGVKSWKLFKQEFGGISGMYMEMWEFSSLADMENNTERLHADEGIKKMIQEFHHLIESTSFSTSIWHQIV
jgi:hypothetical protein